MPRGFLLLSAAMNFDDYDVGNGDLLASVVQDLKDEGCDSASVDLLVRMAGDGELLDVAEVLGGLAAQGSAADAGEILRMITFRDKRRPPDYDTAATLLSMVVEQGVDNALKIVPFLLVYQQQGPDIYDVAFTLGHMVANGKAKQASKLMMALYADESEQGQAFKSMVPCLMGTMIDYQHVDWAMHLVQGLCQPGQGPTDYGAAGWCLAQHVFFRRPDWAASICYALRGQPPPWYSQDALLQSVVSWGGPEYARQIHESLRSM